MTLAQKEAQLTWRGYVSGSAVLYIQGDRVDVQGRETGSVDRPEVDLRNPLPPVRQTVQMDKRLGRGRVSIVEQPVPRNEFTAIVRIDPVGTQHEFFEIDFLWDPYAADNRGRGRMQSRRRAEDYGYRGRQESAYGGGGEMTWSGTVDTEAIIEVRGQRASVRSVRGRQVRDANADFLGPLPRRAGTTVRLEQVSGRGRAELLEQPDSANSYTALVRVVDTQAGTDHYEFRMFWDEGADYSQSQSSSSGVLTPNGGISPDPNGNSVSAASMRWTARVDGTVRVSVRGNRAWTNRVSGGPVSGENAQFSAAMPRANAAVDVRKISGRGSVNVVQHPDAGNGYTLVFEIADDSAGSDDYEIEVAWR